MLWRDPDLVFNAEYNALNRLWENMSWKKKKSKGVYNSTRHHTSEIKSWWSQALFFFSFFLFFVNFQRNLACKKLNSNCLPPYEFLHIKCQKLLAFPMRLRSQLFRALRQFWGSFFVCLLRCVGLCDINGVGPIPAVTIYTHLDKALVIITYCDWVLQEGIIR